MITPTQKGPASMLNGWQALRRLSLSSWRNLFGVTPSPSVGAKGTKIMNSSYNTGHVGWSPDYNSKLTLQSLKGLTPSDAAAGSVSLARDFAKMTDELLGKAITAVIGEGWALLDLKGRLQSVRVRNEPQETIMLDGKPLVELWPVELETFNEGGKITIKATRKYRTFTPQNDQGDGRREPAPPRQ